ncbi:hypothetical protein [Parasphingorhabdus sp.]|uniref:hypothetical protein n=1 Tax=Parasphingorhabdus sp. TaxID=2709688 RepID=UPI002B274F4D|nr:hypothetical protein [Parasphingorhabdus sp.]
MTFRALQRRVEKLETVRKPRPSPFVIWFGSLDAFVDTFLVPGIQSGLFDPFELIDIVAAIRRWEKDCAWELAYAR